MREVQITTKPVDFALNIHSVDVSGFIDATTTPLLEETIRELRDGEVIRVIMDLEGVDHISGSGWRVILATAEALRQLGGDLKVAGLSPELEAVFQLLEFDRIFSPYVSIETARKKFHEDCARRGFPGGPRDEMQDHLTV